MFVTQLRYFVTNGGAEGAFVTETVGFVTNGGVEGAFVTETGCFVTNWAGDAAFVTEIGGICDKRGWDVALQKKSDSKRSHLLNCRECEKIHYSWSPAAASASRTFASTSSANSGLSKSICFTASRPWPILLSP